MYDEKIAESITEKGKKILNDTFKKSVTSNNTDVTICMSTSNALEDLQNAIFSFVSHDNYDTEIREIKKAALLLSTKITKLKKKAIIKKDNKGGGV